MNGLQNYLCHWPFPHFLCIHLIYFFQKRLLLTFAIVKMVAVAQLVRASDCGSEGRRFEPG